MLLDRIAQLEATQPGAAVKQAKAKFKVAKGEEHLLHVLETKVNGQPQTPARERAYDPNQYDTMISKQHGYEAEILHDPRKTKSHE